MKQVLKTMLSLGVLKYLLLLALCRFKLLTHQITNIAFHSEKSQIIDTQLWVHLSKLIDNEIATYF